MPYQIFVELSRKHQRANSLLNTPVTKKEKDNHINQKETERSVSFPNAVEWIYTISFDGGQQRERARGREVVSRPCQNSYAAVTDASLWKQDTLQATAWAALRLYPGF